MYTVVHDVHEVDVVLSIQIGIEALFDVLPNGLPYATSRRVKKMAHSSRSHLMHTLGPAHAKIHDDRPAAPRHDPARSEGKKRLYNVQCRIPSRALETGGVFLVS